MLHFTGAEGAMRRLREVGRDVSIGVGACVVFALSAAATMYVTMHQPVVRAPAVVGRPLPEATQLAERAGLTLQVKSTVHDERYPAQVVIGQWPPSGMSVKRGQALRVTVSLGPRLSASAGERRVVPVRESEAVVGVAPQESEISEPTASPSGSDRHVVAQPETSSPLPEGREEAPEPSPRRRPLP